MKTEANIKAKAKKITKDTFKAALKETSVRGFGGSAARQGCVAS